MKEYLIRNESFYRMNFFGGKNRIFTSTTFQGTEDKKQEGDRSLTSEDKQLIIKWYLLCCYAGRFAREESYQRSFIGLMGADFAMRTLHQLLIGNPAMQSLFLEVICQTDSSC